MKKKPSRKLLEEIWKPIKGYDGIYEVSNFGRIKSYRNNKWGIKKEFRVLKPGADGFGYKFVYLWKNKEKHLGRIHRLVANAFCLNPNKKPEVNHLDANPSNNHADNLEWVTKGENLAYAYKIGNRKPIRLLGDDSPVRKLSSFQVQRIRLMKEITPSLSFTEIAKIFKVTRPNIASIIKRKTWAEI
jgi:hypothetical protein